MREMRLSYLERAAKDEDKYLRNNDVNLLDTVCILNRPLHHLVRRLGVITPRIGF